MASSSSVTSQLPSEVPERISFPLMERQVLSYWDSIDAFHTANKLSEGKPVFSFYDGPPFATGKPHYGHLLAGTIKDVVTRFAYQTGHHVPRRFGWDCHGLPIEFEIEKMLNIKSKEQILQLGVDKYNEHCRSIVMRYSGEWESTVQRMGRWIDFKNDYKSMDTSFMESVWWVFGQLFEKGLVYQGFKVMPYSTGCATPLSNFEANSNYKDVDDPAITVSFPVLDVEDEVSFVAWTTTPWTLPSNLALCVNPDLTYVYVNDPSVDKTYIIAEKRLVHLFKKPKKGAKPKFDVLKKVKGSQLVGLKYKPLFNYFYEDFKDRAFKVVADSYVTDTDGTGIVHQAPAFGEDDYRVCVEKEIIDPAAEIPCPLDANANFTSPVEDFKGQFIKQADGDIMDHLKEHGRLVKKANINHRYAFCWRSETPLINRAVPAWFIRVTDLKDKLVEYNNTTKWVPASVQHNRFGDWLKNARDWNVSRNRYWGTPLPIWMNEETGEKLCVSSIEQLKKLSGVDDITDLHIHNIDHITIKSPNTGDTLRRVSEVFDCWFESGSMPYAQAHYPFENEDSFEKSFPADFIAEGLDQTRGWFYTLMVLSTALFDKAPFKNCVVNGLVLAEDGKKMSKRLKNYPEPTLLLDSIGADALRLYLINSPAVRAEPLKFREDGVRGVVREVMLPWYNALRFLVQNTRHLGLSTGVPVKIEDATIYKEFQNEMDRWIESALSSLIDYFRQEMGEYRLYTIVPKLVAFIQTLTDWYVRLNRPRLKGSAAKKEEQRAALGTLAHVLLSLSRLMAPFAPFFADYSYRVLKPMAPKELQMDCVHFLMLPTADTSAVDTSFEEAVEHMREVITLGRVAREHKDIALKQPLSETTIVHRDSKVLDKVKILENYVKSELNVKEVKYSTEENRYFDLKADADGKVLGKRLGKNFKKVHKFVREMAAEAVADLESKGELAIDDITIKLSEVNISRELKDSVKNNDGLCIKESATGLLVTLNTEISHELRQEGLVREVANRVQKLRKDCGLEAGDKIEVFYNTDDTELKSAIHAKGDVLARLLKSPTPLPRAEMNNKAVVLGTSANDTMIGEAKIHITLARAALAVSLKKIIAQDNNINEQVAGKIEDIVLTRKNILNIKSGIVVNIVHENKTYNVSLQLGHNVFQSTAERVAAGAPQ